MVAPKKTYINKKNKNKKLNYFTTVCHYGQIKESKKNKSYTVNFYVIFGKAQNKNFNCILLLFQ